MLQTYSVDLSAIAALSGAGYARRISAGSWALDTIIPASRGGTGFNTYAEGDIPYGNAGGTLSKIPDPGLPGYVLANGPSWVQLSTLTATTITGTANQVLVNGTSGSGQTGPVTLTLPQNIDTGATPTFAGINAAVGLFSSVEVSDLVILPGNPNVGGSSFTFYSSINRAYLGISTSTDGIIVGSVLGDGVWRNVAGRILFSVDDGNSASLVISSSGIQTAAPSGGTAKPQKMGSIVTAASVLDTTRYLEWEVDGVACKLALIT